MNENYNKNIYSVSDISNIDLARDNEFKLFIDLALLKHFKGNWTKAAMLSCYAHMFKKHKLNPFICEDSFFAQLYEKDIRSIEKTKKELKDEGFITTERKGLDPRKYISVNMEKVFEIYKNFGEQKSSEFLAGAQPPKSSGTEPPKSSGGIYNNDNIIKKYNNINAREGDFLRVEDNNNPIQNFEKNIPASGSPSSPKVDELRLAEEVFENRFWVLVQNKVGKEKAKKRFFRITKNCKSEEKVNEVVEGYKRYLSFLAKNKANNFNRRPKDPETFLNIENKLWLEPWEFNEDEVVLSAGSSRIKQPENWKNRISIAKRLGLLENFEREEINDMYDKEWKFVPNEAKQAIASEKVDVEYKERAEQKRKREIELKEKTLKKREKEVECQNLGEKLKQLEFEIKKPFLSWIEETFDLSSLIKAFKMHMLLKFAVPENVSEFSMLKFYKDELWMSSEIDRMLEEKLGDDKEFVEKKQEYENELRKYDEGFKKHRKLVKEIEDLDKDITNLALEQQKLNK